MTKKLLLFVLLAVAVGAYADDPEPSPATPQTVIVEANPYGSITDYAPGTHSVDGGTSLTFAPASQYSGPYITVNGKPTSSDFSWTVPTATTAGTYRVSGNARFIKIEDTVWSRQATKPAGTYYDYGTGIWTRCFWTSQTEAFGGCTLNGVAVSPVTDNWYFIAAPTTTNLYFRAVKASYNVTVTQIDASCSVTPVAGTYPVGKSFTFTVKPNANFGVNVATGNYTFATITKPMTFTIPIDRSTTVTLASRLVSVTYKGGAFAQSPFNSASSTENITAPKEVTVAPASGYALYKLTDNGKEVGFSGGTYTAGTDANHTLELTPVTITVAQNPVGTCSPAPGVYTNGVASFAYSCTSTNSAWEIEGVYFGGEKLTATNSTYTVKATKPNSIWVKVGKFPPSPSVGGVVASVSFTASGSWQYVTFTDPKNFDPTTGQKILPHYGDAVMIQALGGDIDVSQSTNLVSTIYTKTAPYQLELSPITIPDGNTLVINKPLPGIWFKGSGSVTISTVQR